MTKNRLPLLFLPAVGALCFLAAWTRSQHDLRILSNGEREAATIVAALKLRKDSTDMVTTIKSEITLYCENGDTIAFSTDNYQRGLVLLHRTTGETESFSSSEARWERYFKILAKEGNDGIQRIIEAEYKKGEGPHRIVGITKVEQAQGWFRLASPPSRFLTEGLQIVDVLDEEGMPIEARFRLFVTTGRFGSQVDQSQAERTRVLPSPVYEFAAAEAEYNGNALHPGGRKDFIMFQENDFGQIRPIATYQHNGKTHVVLSDIGKLKDEMPTLSLFDTCCVAFLQEQPEQAIILADFSRIEATEKLLWLSKASGAIFSRWAHATIAVIVALVCFAAGMVLVSLTTHPHPESGFHRATKTSSTQNLQEKKRPIGD